MEKRKLNHFKKLLLNKRSELNTQLGIIRENSFQETMKNSSGDNSSYSFHMADQGTDSQEREKAFLFASREGRLIYHIDQALERIEEGTYSICQECGNPITEERLEVVPHARLCIECKSHEEKQNE